MKFEYFDHTADTLFRAYGATLEEALSNLILAVYNVIVDTSTVDQKEEKHITITAKTMRSLIYDLIDELIFYQDTEGFLVSKVRNLSLQRGETLQLTATLIGDSQSQKYDVFSQIKSPTYSDMIIHEKDNIFIQAVLDL